MRVTLALASMSLAGWLTACVGYEAPINSSAFEKRPPLPGRPDYQQTIGFIDSGMRYLSPASGFFVSGGGDMCFWGALVPEYTPVYIPTNYWCMSPFSVGRVEAIENDVTYLDQVRLWCRLGAPQCAYKVSYPMLPDYRWIANSITAEIVPFQQQRDAIAYLVYLMGGNLETPQALQ
jgi:hypothetical protein